MCYRRAFSSSNVCFRPDSPWNLACTIILDSNSRRYVFIGLINVIRLVRTVDVTSVDFTNKDVRNAFSNAEKSDDKSKINTCVGSHSFHKIKFQCAFKQMTILENYVYLTSKNYPIMLGHSKLSLRQNYCLIFV